MATLYEIVQDIGRLEELLESMDEGDATYDTVKEYLDNLGNLDFNSKVENIVKLIKNYESNAEMFKQEKNRLYALEKSNKNKAENLKQYLSGALTFRGFNHVNKKKVETSIGKVGFQKLPASIKVTDVSKVPQEFIKPRKMDEDVVAKSELLKRLKEGLNMKEVTEINYEDMGIKLVNNGESLRIK